MRKLGLVVTTLALLALPLTAQRGGSANRATPTLNQSIAFANGCTVEISYRAITWAQGRFMESLKTEQGRTRANTDLKTNPTGSLNTSHDITVAGQAVKKGNYKLYFQVDDEQKFHLVLATDAGDETKMKLNLAETKDMNTRLSLSLTAGKGDRDANIGVAFGQMACTLALVGEAGNNEKKAKEAAAGTGEGKKG